MYVWLEGWYHGSGCLGLGPCVIQGLVALNSSLCSLMGTTLDMHTIFHIARGKSLNLFLILSPKSHPWIRVVCCSISVWQRLYLSLLYKWASCHLIWWLCVHFGECFHVCPYLVLIYPKWMKPSLCTVFLTHIIGCDLNRVLFGFLFPWFTPLNFWLLHCFACIMELLAS